MTEISGEHSSALVAALTEDGLEREAFLTGLGGETAIGVDLTDGLRLTLASARIVHLRPSGNAPELRFYTEAETPEIASTLLAAGLTFLNGRLHGGKMTG